MAEELVESWRSILDHRGAELVSRAMDLTVTTRGVVATQTVLRKIFAGHGFDAEIRGINRQTSDEPLGSVAYLVGVSPLVTTDDISAQLLSQDGANVASVEWKQKKSPSYMYQ